MTQLMLLALLAAAPDPAADAKPFFPIMAWNSPPNDLATLRRMRECGLTVAGFVPPEALDNCREAGLRAIVSDERVSGYDWNDVKADAARSRVGELVRRVREHPAVFGYYLRDEPPAGFFPGLAVVAGFIKELHPGAWPYINLFPNYATPGQLGTPDYEAYLRKFVEVCRPPVLSYDHYALFEGGGLRESYFANLEAVRRVAVENHLPFWNIVLAVAHFNYREPSAADLRFEVYTSLAYGARGIAYFTYFAPPQGNYRAAPVDQFGNETETWGRMRNVNLQVARLGPTLLKLTSDRVYHFGKVPTGCTGPDKSSLVEAIGGAMLVGDFTHEDGARYVLVVNKDLAGSVPCQPRFRKAPSRLEMVSPYTGERVPFEGEQVWLAPGQGALLKLIPRGGHVSPIAFPRHCDGRRVFGRLSTDRTLNCRTSQSPISTARVEPQGVFVDFGRGFRYFGPVSPP